MKSNYKKKIDLTKFESIKMKGTVLKGGFSMAIGGSAPTDANAIEINGNNVGNCPTNNCNGGNCVTGCGAK